jgi:arsenite methyltransferase
MSGLTFTEDAARHLARVYLTPDVVAQRSETMKQLALSPGERVLDVGCGPGFLCESIAAAVGGGGAVTGIDISGDLITLCKTRNPPQWLSYAVGDATQPVGWVEPLRNPSHVAIVTMGLASFNPSHKLGITNGKTRSH